VFVLRHSLTQNESDVHHLSAPFRDKVSENCAYVVEKHAGVPF